MFVEELCYSTSTNAWSTPVSRTARCALGVRQQHKQKIGRKDHDDTLRKSLLNEWELLGDAKSNDKAWSSAFMRAASSDPQDDPFVSTKEILLRRWRIHVLEALLEQLMGGKLSEVQDRR